MKKVNFLFGIHCHQPIGNFEHVFEEAYEKAYLPFIKVLENHPRIRVTVHYSGVLYDWFIEKHPEFIENLRKLVKRRQLEILSSGYYEPILSIIPDDDKLGQIEMSNRFIREQFGLAPQGMWLTERVWEPNLPKFLVKKGIEYVMVDDYHFTLAGIKNDHLYGHYVTEDEGETLNIFPINRKLRDLIPFRPPEETINYLKRIANEEGNAAAICIDDGEKLGLRPETHQFVYEEGYLEELFSQIEANSKWLRAMTFSEYLEEFPAKGRIYLPTASYHEMMDWSGGFFRNFFVKYPEANNMHKKMLYVSNRLNTLRKSRTLFGDREKDKQLNKALQHLYKAQCACAYWHGSFGGQYFNHLRHAVYSQLIRAEIEMEKFSRGGKAYAELSVTDVDKDGKDEVILANSLLNLYFSPHYGGSLFELDYKPKAFNLVNTLARREEGYHQEGLAYDQHLRYSLMDHFLPPDADLDKFSSAAARETGNFIGQSYTFMPKRRPGEVGLALSREGEVDKIPVRVEKSISLLSKQSIVNIEYKVTNRGEQRDEFWFGVEFNLSMLDGNSKDRYYSVKGIELEDNSLGSKGETANVSLVKAVDGWSGFDVSLELGKPALLWRFPVETLSQSDGEMNHDYQSSVVFPSWRFSLEPKGTWELKITLRIEE
jgi:alpha-amylase